MEAIQSGVNFLYFVSLILLLLFDPLFSGDNLKFDHLTGKDGLSSSRTTSILQDSKDFIWIATRDGLNKYDGYTFTVFRNDPADSNSLSSNNITDIYEDHEDKLWISTIGGGLNKLDPETETFTRYIFDPDNPAGISSNNLEQTIEHRYGSKYILWVATGNGLNKFDFEQEKFTHYPIPEKDFPYGACEAIAVDSTGIVWTGYKKGGIYKFNPYTGEYTHYPPQPNNPDGLSGSSISWLSWGSSSILWIGTRDGGLNKFDLFTERFTRYMYDPDDPKSLSSNFVEQILQDRSGRFWVGNADGGLNQLDEESGQFTRYKHDPGDPASISDNTVTTIYEDKSGVLWIGTWKGVSKTDPGKSQFYDIKHIPGNPNSLSGNWIVKICDSKFGNTKTLWVGTKTEGLNYVDLDKGEITRYKHDPSDPESFPSQTITTLYVDNSNILWIGTYGQGLIKYDRQTKKFSRYRNDYDGENSMVGNIIQCIMEDKSGVMWVAARASGLHRFDRKTGKFTLQGSRTGMQYIMEDKSGILWYGGYTGLERLNLKTGEHKKYHYDPDNPYSISNNTINMIHESNFQGKDVIWVGTEAGLNRLDPESEKFYRYTAKDGLVNDMINGILEDDQANLWLSTNNGLSKFDPQSGTFRNYDVFDGLLSNQAYFAACFKGRDGALYFGGYNGVNYFFPDQIRDNTWVPEIVITGFRIFNKPVAISKNLEMKNENDFFLSNHISATPEIVLSYRENIFSFEFTALDYRSPLKNKYAYKMEGVDPDWVYTDASRRFATYTNLDPGEYIFSVKGSNNDGLWNETGTSVRVIITPPWWETRLAYIFYVVFFISLVVATWRAQIRRIHFNQQLKMKHFEAEKLREVDQLKSQFFTNISHEFRTPLTLIKGPVRQMLDGKFIGNLKDQYKMILRNSDRLLGLINQILDLSRLESGKLKLRAQPIEIVTLSNGLVQAFESLARKENIGLKFCADLSDLEAYIDVEKYETIINNLLSNAFKATPQGGEVQVNISNSKTSPIELGEDGPALAGTGGVSEMASPNPSSGSFPYSNGKERKGCIQITVSNTGPGIPAEQLEHIFERFYQVDDSYQKDENSTGIGLALTKELVEACHGRIHVRSTPGEPTTFTVELPVSKEAFKEDEIVQDTLVRAKHSDQELLTKPENSEKNASPQQSDKAAPLVLIVEDNPDVTHYIYSFMAQDYQILTAENGKEGFKKAIGKYPDLIISDVMMPVMDGFELCAKIKTDQHTSHIPVILLTARAGQEDKFAGLETGADDYITKPFNNQELQVRVKNLIEQRRLLREKFSHMTEIKLSEIATSSKDEHFLKRLIDVFEAHVDESDFSTRDFAREVGMSRSSLHRKLIALTNQPTHEFLRSLRLKRAAQLLKKTAGTVTEVAYAVGFNNPSHFSKVFRQHFGQTPTEFASLNNQQSDHPD